MKSLGLLLGVAVLMSACAMASPVMDMGNGIYMISARAAPVRGGATGAYGVAYKDAQEFCARRGDGLRPVVVDTQDRDIYQSSIGGGWGPSGGGFGGSTAAAGSAALRFRCAA